MNFLDRWVHEQALGWRAQSRWHTNRLGKPSLGLRNADLTCARCHRKLHLTPAGFISTDVTTDLGFFNILVCNHCHQKFERRETRLDNASPRARKLALGGAR